jgi:hypothetical protein
MTRDFPARQLSIHPGGVSVFERRWADSGFEVECMRFDRLLPLAERLRRPQNMQNILRMRDGP